MGRKTLANSTKFLNALLRGQSVTWKEAQTKFNLSKPRAVVDKIREEGHCVYINKNKSGTYYRIGTPSKAIIAAGFAALEPSVYA
jgi:DNA-binding IclR family transcriptional regulator|tara:strand:+ start:2328 stop:2582 length:255 start_codon:yes stop_codon:yes gene_type:complete